MLIELPNAAFAEFSTIRLGGFSFGHRAYPLSVFLSGKPGAVHIALCCVVAWRISWLTILVRQAPAGSPEAVFTHPERILLERATPQKRKNAPRDLAFYMTALARLGGYLDRNSDPPPGTTVIWRIHPVGRP